MEIDLLHPQLADAARRNSHCAPWIILIRVLVGWVFVSEGIQKFLFPAALGTGRFAQIGIPAPDIMAPFVGVVEIACGALLLIGFYTRLAAIPMIFDILVAIFTTKFPLFFQKGFWAGAHESRTDFSMLLGLLFLFLVGGGWWSIDAWSVSRKQRSPH